MTLAASILSADLAHLANDVNAVLAAGIDTIHFDVMDMHYVPNLSFGPMVCRALRDAGITATIDVHLMVESPQNLVTPFAEAGADIISFHPSTVTDVAAVLAQIKENQIQAGLVFNPDQEPLIEADWLDQLDMILLMSVFPGFGGQSFMPSVLPKIQQTRQWINASGRDIILAVDGGVKVDNIAQIAAAGANYFVIGSGLFAASDYRQRVVDLQQALSDLA